MKGKYFVLLAVMLVLFSSCKNEKKGNELMPEIQQADSATVMYYNSPNNPRFFKYTKIKDIKLLQPVINDVGKTLIKKKDDCATQGKIYFYVKGSEVYVVYFSDTEGCMTLSFIVTGEKYYTRMKSDTRKILDSLKTTAREPAVANE